jgi:hypothetical protein
MTTEGKHVKVPDHLATTLKAEMDEIQRLAAEMEQKRAVFLARLNGFAALLDLPDHPENYTPIPSEDWKIIVFAPNRKNEEETDKRTSPLPAGHA